MARDPRVDRARRARIIAELQAEGFSLAQARGAAYGHRRVTGPTLVEAREAQTEAFGGETAREAWERLRWARRVLAGTSPSFQARATFMRHGLSVEGSQRHYPALYRVLHNTNEIDPESYVFLSTDQGAMHDPGPVRWVLEEFLPAMGDEGEPITSGRSLRDAIAGFNSRYNNRKKTGWTLDVWMPGEGKHW